MSKSSLAALATPCLSAAADPSPLDPRFDGRGEAH
jgi:hypothetical protein